MKHGFIKCAAISPEISVADVALNAEYITELIKRAEALGADIVVLPELSLTGATCGDMLLSDTLLQSALNALISLSAATANLNIISVIGLPVKYDYKVYNCAAVIHSGEILGIIPKTNLTNAEKRYFTSAESLPNDYNALKLGTDIAPLSSHLIFRHNDIESYRFAVQIGSDLFAASDNADSLAAAGATIVLNPAAINYTPENENSLSLFTTSTSARLYCGYVLSNAGNSESTTDVVYSGHSIITECGEVVAENPSYSGNNILITEIDVNKAAAQRAQHSFPIRPNGFTDILFSSEIRTTELTRKINRAPFEPKANKEYFYEKTLTAAACGLKKRIDHTHCKSLVLGISGGLDSTLALLICIRAAKLCGKDLTDITAVTMPCFGTTERTKTNAEILCENLGVTLKTVDIKAAVSQHFKDIGHDGNNRNVTFENAQARERTQILMDIANDIGGIVIGTGDLSELALGFATYNGDQMSMYGVNGSIPKTLIRSLVAYEAQKFGGIIGRTLTDILETPVSPELLPPENGQIGQVTEELVGPYELHDFFIYNIVKNGFTPAKTYRLATAAFCSDYTPDVILKWLKVFVKRFFAQQFKRSCMPDGVQVTDVSFSPRGGFVMPSDISAKIWLNELENL